MNFLNYLSDNDNKVKDVDITVFTTFNKTVIGLDEYCVNSSFIKINRTKGILKSNIALIRFYKYFVFNFYSLIQLILFKPISILYYETMSSWAPMFYKKFFNKNCKLICHYHEYTSLTEYKTGSYFGKLLWKFEQKNFDLLDVVSHTNHKRMKLFQEDYKNISFKKTLILPNYPPKSWASQKNTKVDASKVLRLVYVGALGLETMYLKPLCEWLLKQNGKVALDIYSINIASDAEKYLQTVIGKEIVLKQGVNYQDLPKILCDYDVGLILYKGHIPNYIYNAPNKLFEYLACGLDVWFPIELLGSYEFIDETTKPLVLKLDFTNETCLRDACHKSRKNKVIQSLSKQQYFCENVYQNLSNELITN